MIFPAVSGFVAGDKRLKCGLTRTKLLRAMKLTALLLTICCIHVFAGSYAQKLTLVEKNAPLEKVFRDIKQQTGYKFLYTVEMLSSTTNVTFDLANVDLSEALNACFKDQPVTFSVIEKTVIVKVKKDQSAADEIDQSQQAPLGDIHGHITNRQGIPLSGANVIIKRTKRGVQTDVKGEFTLKNVRAEDSLVISFIGYKSQTIRVGGSKDFVFIMNDATDELDKVVIQAYGITTQRLNTGNITTVTAAEIERQPVMNPLIALEGKVPGVIVTPTSGYASAPIKIEIRGRSVIDGGQPSDPLYIIDGVPLTVLNLSNSNYGSGSSGFAQTNSGPAGGQSPFFSINPQDVESITVLKDADATAIYGSRGANGVIIITTKTGKPGKTKMDLNVYQGESFQNEGYDLMNTKQYLMMRREAFKNDQASYGIIPGETIPDGNIAYDLVTWDTTRFTNFQKLFYGGMGHTTDVELGLSGGDQQNTFRIAGDYHKETSIITRSGADQRESVQFNYNHKSLNQRLNLNLTSLYSFTESDLIAVGGNIAEAPDAPPIFNSQAVLNWAGWQPVPYNIGGWSSLLQPYNGKSGFLNSRLSLQYEIFKGLIFSTQLGYSSLHGSNTSLIPISSLNPFINPKGQSTFGNTNLTNSIVEPQLEYKGMIGRGGKLSGLLGASAQSVDGDITNAVGQGYINDNLLRSVSNAPIRIANNGSSQYKYDAVYARINYNWKDEYLLNLSARRDGSSRFGPGKQFGNFWAVGAAWIFTEENWAKQHLNILSFGKLRASYGLTGNDQIGDYGYLTQWSGGGSSGSITPYQGNEVYIPLGHANPNLEWETNYKLEGAIDLGILKDRITGEVAVYRNRCGNQLINYRLPYLTGFTYVMQNFPGTIQNTGLEITVKAKIIDQQDFSWSMSFNIGRNRNKLISFPNLDQSPYATLYTVGQSLSIVHLLHYTGVDPQTGQYTYLDKNHNGVIDFSYNNGYNDLFNKDMAIKFDGGTGTDFRYKGWQLNLYFHFREQELVSGIHGGVPGTIEANQSVQVLNRWQKPGDHAPFARFTTQPQTSDELFTFSDGYYTDGSYFRLRNVSLSYETPNKWIRHTGFQKCMIYARGQNLFILTKYDGADPDTPGFGNIPPAKVFTMGIQFTL
jgi:TonB-linked SusC/RagA family outer membrane protein